MPRRSERAAPRCGAPGAHRTAAIRLALALALGAAWSGPVAAAPDLAPPPVVGEPSASDPMPDQAPDQTPDQASDQTPDADAASPVAGAPAGTSASTSGAPRPQTVTDGPDTPVALPVPGPFVPLDPREGVPAAPVAPPTPQPGPETLPEAPQPPSGALPAPSPAAPAGSDAVTSESDATSPDRDAGPATAPPEDAAPDAPADAPPVAPAPADPAAPVGQDAPPPAPSPVPADGGARPATAPPEDAAPEAPADAPPVAPAPADPAVPAGPEAVPPEPVATSPDRDGAPAGPQPEDTAPDASAATTRAEDQAPAAPPPPAHDAQTPAPPPAPVAPDAASPAPPADASAGAVPPFPEPVPDRASDPASDDSPTEPPATAPPVPGTSAQSPAAPAPAVPGDVETPAASPQGPPAADAPPAPAGVAPAPAGGDAAPAVAEESSVAPASRVIDPSDAALLAAARDGGMGSAHLASECPPTAQASIDAALALLHAGYAPAARAGFAEALDQDRRCAGAQIGLALAYWAEGGGAEHLDAGRAALDSARTLGVQHRMDAAWIEALGAYFDGSARSLPVRRGAFRERLRRMHTDMPDDDDVAMLYAVSLVDQALMAPGVSPPPASQAAQIAAAVLGRQPGHAGAARTVMRARSSMGDLLGALQGAQAWMAAAPRAPGAPLAAARLAARLGLYEQAAEYAATARSLGRDLRLTAVEAAAGAARADAALQLCAVSAAQDALNGLVALDGAAITQAAWAQVALWLETQDWSAAVRAAPPPEPLLATALVLYGQAVGAVRLGEPAAAAEAVRRLDALRAPDPTVGQPLAVLRLVGRALTTPASDPAAALEAYDAAITLENGIGGALVAPLPAALLKGDALVALARPREALAAYEHALTRFPNRRAALVGAYSAALALGEDERAQAYRDRLAPACKVGSTTAPTAGKR